MPPAPANNDKRRIAIFDLDRTITRIPTFTPFLLSTRQSWFSRAALLSRIAGPIIGYKSGKIARVDLKNKMLAFAFKGWDQPRIESVIENFIENTIKGGLYDQALAAIADHKANGDILILATASIDVYAGRFADELGFDALIATKTQYSDDAAQPLQIIGENCYGEAKKRMVFDALEPLFGAPRSDLHLTFYTDHHSDMALLTCVDAPIAVNPSRQLQTEAAQHNMKILDWRRKETTS